MPTTPKEDKELLKNYLNLFKIDSKIYLIGIFQQGITVYKQQIRALNIFYSLCKTVVINNKSDKKFHVGVIGAGVAGLTFAAAALKAGLIVTLMERESKPLHLQYGCDIRKIHPNLYDWPDKDSLFPYARIPILTWKYDSAANVARQIVSEFNSIVKQHSSNYSSIFDVQNIITTTENDKIYCALKSYQDIDRSKQRTPVCAVDLLIYATGYGIERGAPSYWRNDDFGQPILSVAKKTNSKTGKHIPKKFFISGVGDGALMDLFRIKVCGFSFDGIYEKARQNERLAFPLIEEIKKIKEDWSKLDEKPAEEECWLYKRFQELSFSSYQFIYDSYLKNNLVNDIEVTINSPAKEVEMIFDLRKISMLNAFIAFVFKQQGLFKYESGTVEFSKNKYYLNGKLLNETVISRHGTDRPGLLKQIGINDEKSREINILQEKNNLFDKNKPLWSFTQLKSLFDEEIPNVSFFTSESVSILSNFVSLLSKLLTNFFKTPRNFRTTIHRIITEGKTVTDGESSLSSQQITSYFGVGEGVELPRDVGRCFEIDKGSVGLSILTGNAFLVKNVNKKSFEDLLEVLKLGDNDNHKSRNSTLTIPILGKFNNRLATNLVLFVDSDNELFFDDPKILDLIIDCLGGFIDSINNLLSDKHLYMSPLEFEPLHCDLHFDFSRYEKNPCFQNLSLRVERLSNKNNQLSFKNSYHSFDIIYRRLLEY